MPTLGAGTWADGRLGIEPFELGLAGWVERHRRPLEATWSVREIDALLGLTERAQHLLDSVDRTCVVHSDLNPKNVLLDPETLVVTGVLDWEFSHSGHPATDVGNLLRFDRAEAYADGIVGTWTDRHGGLRHELVDLARAADLAALVELAARAGQNPVATRAEARLRAIATSGDLHAE